MPAFQYCPDCAAPLPIDPERPHAAQRCARCRAVHYHNSKPCAGALITRRGGCGSLEILLGRRKFEPFAGHWDVPGGFLEPGEGPADGARREAREETGLHVRLDDLFAILVDTYDTTGEYTLNLYYRATIIGGTPHPADDIAELGWFSVTPFRKRSPSTTCAGSWRGWLNRRSGPRGSWRAGRGGHAERRRSLSRPGKRLRRRSA